MEAVQLLKKRNYFIHPRGICFKVENGKEIKFENILSENKRKVYTIIDGEKYELLNLMIEHFIGEIKSTEKIKFTIGKDCTIQLNSIKISDFFTPDIRISAEDEINIKKYDCNTKATSANRRSKQVITGLQVYHSLCTHNFKCIYCGSEIYHDNWHLDHFISLYKNGKNTFENVVPSCPTCNIMKGALEGYKFFKMCKKIAKNFKFRPENEAKPFIV